MPPGQRERPTTPGSVRRGISAANAFNAFNHGFSGRVSFPSFVSFISVIFLWEFH